MTWRFRDTPVTCTATSRLFAISVIAQRLRQERDAEVELHRALDAVEAGQRDHHVERDVVLLEQAQDALARRRRIVVGHHGMSRELRHRDVTAPRQLVRGRDEQHELVAADRDFEQAFFGRMECQRAEVEAPLLDFDGDLPRRDTADVDRDVGETAAETPDQRQQRVDGGFVGADQHASAPQVAQLPHGRFGLLGQAHETLPVVLEHPAGVGQGARLRGAIEQLLAEVDFEPADGLAHRGLRAVDLGRGPGETALLGHGQEGLQGGDIHKFVLFYRNDYHFDF